MIWLPLSYFWKSFVNISEIYFSTFLYPPNILVYDLYDYSFTFSNMPIFHAFISNCIIDSEINISNPYITFWWWIMFYLGRHIPSKWDHQLLHLLMQTLLQRIYDRMFILLNNCVFLWWLMERLIFDNEAYPLFFCLWI